MKSMMALVLCFFCVSSALADDPRKIDFLTKLNDLDNQPLKFCARNDEAIPSKCAELKDWTLSDLAISALAVQEKDESGTEQMRRMMLAQTIYKKAEAVLDAKDTDMLCEAIAKFVNRAGQSALLTLRAWEILDPARVKR